MKVVKHLSRIIVGVVFIFSGFVKGIDPWGSSYKFTDYFHAMDIGWLDWAAFPLGVLLSFTEFAIGVALLFNLFMRFFAWLALLFMIFFTALTLWIAIENPVTDCGCFGDALVISNWETFYKNIVLLVLSIIVFFYRSNMPHLVNKKIPYSLGALFTAAYIAVVIYSYNHLPVLDFRPYKVGVNIPEAMSYPENAPQDVYENIFYYKNKNTGKVKEFTEENYPWQDTVNWVFESMETNLVEEGYKPPVKDFAIETPEGDNVIDFFIQDENYVFMIIAYDLSKTNMEAWDEINELAAWAGEQGMPFIGLTSSLPDESANFIQEHGLPFEFFNTDEITLKTMIRSNPGLMVLKNGTVVAKYHYNDIPEPEEFREEVMNNDVPDVGGE